MDRDVGARALTAIQRSSDEPLGEGFYWHMPWNDVFTYSVQWRSFSEKIDVLTEDDLHIQLQASVRVRPLAEKFRQIQMEVGDDFYTNIVRSEFLSVVRNVMAESPMVAIPEHGAEIEAKMMAALRSRIRETILGWVV